MTRIAPSWSWSVAALCLLLAGLVGAAVAIAGSPQRVPPALASATPVRDVPVGSRTYDDQRTVELTVETGGERQISAPVAGTITASDCSPGKNLLSGRRVAAIDGQTIVGLASAEPLWRDLADGDRGDDVRALQTELGRLGFAVRADGVVGPKTLAAVGALLDRKGTIDAVPVASFAWLPAPSVATSACRARLGSTIDAGAAIALLPPELTHARITSLPSRLVAGARRLSVGDTDLPVASDGTVSDPVALAAIAASPDYATAARSEDATGITARYALAEPLRVSVVPPTAVYGVRGAAGCVASGNNAVHVDIVGSELGETFVVPRERQRLDRVSVASGRPRCA